MRASRSLLIVGAATVFLGGVALGSCSSKVSFPSGGQSVPPTFNTVTVAWLPTSCSAQTFFEASTVLCPSGPTYLLCDGSSYSGYDCAEPGGGWNLESTLPDPVASGPSACVGDGGLAPHGSIYVEANVAAPAKNAVLQYRYCNGGLVQTVVGRYPTGGSGAADLGDNGILDADQQVVVNASQTLLFAINQGSDSIAAFHIASDGQLSTVAGSPFPSHGPAPASLGVSGNVLVVANKASDGVRNLSRDTPSYATFAIQADGSLTHTMTLSLPVHSSPTQVYVAPGGSLVFGTEETGVLRGLQLSSAGALTQAPGSPVSLPNSLFTDGGRPQPVWPAGLSSAPRGSVLYTGVPNYGSIAAFDFTDAGALTLLSGEREPEGSLPCWSVVSDDGRFLYFANAGSANVSVWDVGTDPGNPAWLQTATLTGGGNPWGLHIDPSGTLLFVIVPRQVRQVPANEGQLLHALRIASDGTLSEIYGSPVPIPVEMDTNPLGVTVVVDR